MENHHSDFRPNELSESAKKSMHSRTIVALILVALILPLAFLGGYFFFTIVLGVFLLSIYEIISVAQKNKEIKYSTFSKICIYLSAIIPMAILYMDNIVGEPLDGISAEQFNLVVAFSQVEINVISIGIMIVIYTTLVIVDSAFTIKDLCYFFFFTLLLVCGYSSLLNLRFLPLLHTEMENTYFTGDVPLWQRCGSSFSLLLFVVMAIFPTDIFAYFVGVLFGRHKMCPKISPKKTWEGFFGGVIGSVALSSTFGILLAYFDYPMLDLFTFDNWWLILITSIAVSLASVLGDLLFSMLKRSLDVKDYGTILKEHGGVLDRLDSIIVGTMVAATLIRVFYLFVSV